MAIITIPENAVPIKKGMTTKKVFFEGKAKNEVNVDKGIQQITNIENELYIKGYFVRPSGICTGCEVKSSIGEITSELSNGSLYDTRSGKYGKVVVIFKKQITINYTPENNSLIFCVPEIPEIPEIEKLPSSSTLTDTINKNIEVKDKINACKNKLAYIINSYNVIASPEEKLSDLINRISDLEIIKIPTISNLRTVTAGGGFSTMSVLFDILDYNSIFPIIITCQKENEEKKEKEISKDIIDKGNGTYQYTITELSRNVDYKVQIKIKNNVSNELIIRLSGVPEVS